MKKLQRSHEHRLVSGVIGGLGEHYHTDPNIFRLVFALFAILTGVIPAIIIYIIAAIIIPEATYIVPSKPIYSEDDDIEI